MADERKSLENVIKDNGRIMRCVVIKSKNEATSFQKVKRTRTETDKLIIAPLNKLLASPFASCR